jgi:beta-mannosidase
MKVNFFLLLLFMIKSVYAEEATKLWQPYYITPRLDNQHTDLSFDWELGYLDNPIGNVSEIEKIQEWIPVEYPVSVQWAMYKAGKLPHPYEHENSFQYRWIEDKLWYYQKEFTLFFENEYVFLCFDGLDYFSRIWLNGELLGRHEGMFGGPAIEISERIRSGQKNILIVEVKSGNQDSEIRKYYTPTEGFFAGDDAKRGQGAPIVKGWAFTGGTGAEHYYTLGMWKGVRVEVVKKTHMERPYLYTESIDKDTAVLSFSTEIFVNVHSLKYKMHPWGNVILSRGTPANLLIPAENLSLKIEFIREGKCAFSKNIPIYVFQGRTWVHEKLEIENPELWWPNGMGEPNLYDVKLTLLEKGNPVDRLQFEFGIRTIERKPSAGPQVEEEWEDWHFIINGKPIFVRGTNWMPADWLLDLTDSRYKWLLEMADQAGMQMIRVWASGIQESESFYKYCNRLGIMVWQDFQISHVITPNWSQYVVEAHVMQNIYRLRNMPSLALWNGGNGMNPYALENSTITSITERYVRRFDPARFYSRSSSAAGNAHLYPDMDPSWYGKLYRYVPFISETGIHSIPEAKNLRKVIRTNEFVNLGDMYSDDFVKEHKEIIHHFAEYNPARVPRMISRASHIDNMKNPSIESIAEATQVGAGEFYQVLTDGMLANYPYSTGLLYWVFNRMWPVFSAIMLVDGHSQPVAPYYFTKRGFEQTHVAVRMERLLWAAGETVNMFPSIINHTEKQYPEATLKMKILDHTFKTLWYNDQAVHVKSGVCVEKLKQESFVLPEDYRNRFFFVVAELFDNHDEMISRSVYWPRTTQLMDDITYRNNYVEKPQAWPVFENGPWLKPTVAKTKTSLIIRDIHVKSKTDDRLVLNIDVVNTGRKPSFMTQINLVEDFCFYLSDNYFWLSSGEAKQLEMHIRLNGESKNHTPTIELSSWNAKKVTAGINI